MMELPLPHRSYRHRLLKQTVNSSPWSDIGKIMHPMSSGYLHTESLSSNRERKRRNATYEIAPAVYSSFGICGTPRCDISNAARTEATVIHIDERAEPAMNRPWTHSTAKLKPVIGIEEALRLESEARGNRTRRATQPYRFIRFIPTQLTSWSPGPSRLTTCFLLRYCLPEGNQAMRNRWRYRNKFLYIAEGCGDNAHQLVQ